ncbi:DUF4397 domain-containing protein [Marinicrinis sediminis]|uniref:DUF4397 domain-containing protein n=1 Tax=Marinicrinis sediminis TaxID=1652465 RepID=A0ABW5R781_9BACL
MFKRLLVFALVLMMVVPVTSAFAEGEEAMVRVVHASPDAPEVDVYVDGNAVLTKVPYKTASQYLALPAGSHEVKVYASSANGSGDPVIAATLDLAAGQKYTVAAVGKLAEIAPVVLNDATSVSNGKAKVRFVHASPDAPAVDVALKGGDAVFANASFKDAADYMELDPGTLDLEVRPAGDSSTVVLPLPGVTFEANTAYTVMAIGLANGTPSLEAWPLVDVMAEMPDAMPKTGMGGASPVAEEQNGVSVWAWAAGLILVSSAMVLYTVRRRVSQQR